jgi:hypothetical protein
MGEKTMKLGSSLSVMLAGWALAAGKNELVLMLLLVGIVSALWAIWYKLEERL